jgi:hypothetical protein
MSYPVELQADLSPQACGVVSTLSSGAAIIPIPEECHLVGVKPTSSTAVRVGLVAPATASTKTGNAALTDLALGFAVDAAVWTWLTLPVGTSRNLYLSGGASDVITVQFS